MNTNKEDKQQTYILTERKIIKLLAYFLEQVEKSEVIRKGNSHEHTVREWLYGKDLLRSVQLADEFENTCDDCWYKSK